MNDSIYGSGKNKFNLEQRTTDFAKSIIILCKKLPNNPINYRLIPQLVASAGSIGANYREANDSLGNKDFILRLKIARKEAKECLHWLELVETANEGISIKGLKVESIELIRILSAIINKIKN